MKLALKIDVDTYRGTREGVLPLVELLSKMGCGATFLFSLGPDHTGRGIRRAFLPGFAKKVSRTSVLEHYGIKTLLYGTLLPGPDIGRRLGDIMRKVRDAGFEVGIHTYDHTKWHNHAAAADAAWTENEMQKAALRFEKIFGVNALVSGAAGWQMNRHAFRALRGLGIRYSSDSRGKFPFIPVFQAEINPCPQLPTTLPTLDEVIGIDGVTPDTVAAKILELSATPPATGHVYTLHAEMEGMKLIGIFEQLLRGWQEMGYEIVSLQDYAAALDVKSLPRHEVVFGEVPGRSGKLTLQGDEFLAD